MNVQAFIPKEVDGIPDSYGVEITIFGGRAATYEVVQHSLVDKVFDNRNVEIGPHGAPFWQFQLKDNDELLCVPAAAAVIKFDSRWYKVRTMAPKQGG